MSRKLATDSKFTVLSMLEGMLSPEWGIDPSEALDRVETHFISTLPDNGEKRRLKQAIGNGRVYRDVLRGMGDWGDMPGIKDAKIRRVARQTHILAQEAKFDSIISAKQKNNQVHTGAGAFWIFGSNVHAMGLYIDEKRRQVTIYNGGEGVRGHPNPAGLTPNFLVAWTLTNSNPY